MKLRLISTTLLLAGTLLATTGCKDFFDVNTDPIHPSTAELSQLLPGTQVAMSTYLGFNIQGLGQPASALTAQITNGRAINSYQQGPTAFATPWSGLYTDMLQNNERIIIQGTQEERWAYVGVAQIQKAYVFSQLVDAFGDVPYSQALLGAAELNPRFDKDADIYNGNADRGIQSLFALIDAGIANLDRPGIELSNGANVDLIYKGSLASWKNLGRTLKLKLYMQIRKTRDVSGDVRPLLTQSLISPGENFELRYSTSTSPENRHIGFLSDYVNAGRENNASPFFYLLMRYGNGFDEPAAAPANPDPRVRYYFYRQNSTAAANRTAFDYQDPFDFKFVGLRPGSTGGASLNTSDSRTLPGLYPYGGRFDNDVNGPVNESSAAGNGIQRLLPYFSRKFIEAELQLMVLNDDALADAAYRDAVNAAFAEVNKVATVVGSATAMARPPVAPTAAILDRFSLATSKEDKLRVLMEQKYIASFGMGMDIYTDFRRTHYPVLPVPSADQADASLGLQLDSYADTNGSGFFPRRFFYPQGDLNANLSPESPDRNYLPGEANYSRIFWDVN